MPNTYLLWIVGYFMGSIPFGYLIGRYNHIDIQKVGSGSTGGTNVARTLGMRWGIVAGTLDLLKSFAFVHILLNVFSLSIETVLILSTAPIVGHIFPIWLRFRGGKGVSVAFGALFAILGWQFALCTLVLWVISLKVIRIMSLANIILFAFLPVLMWFTLRTPFSILFGLIVALLVIWAHRQNIYRLRDGNESKLHF